jgi:hypothetical protein
LLQKSLAKGGAGKGASHRAVAAGAHRSASRRRER